MKLRSCFPICTFLIISLFILQPIYSQIIPGEIQHHEPDEEIIWDWYSYVPTELRKTDKGYILITVEGSNFDYEVNMETVYNEIQSKLVRANPLGLIQIGIAIPRKEYPQIYTVAFQFNSFYEETEDFYRRADLKTTLIIDRLIGMLKNEGYNISQKVFLEGFSNGGGFTYYYSLLHPDRVQAIAGGGTHFLTLPETTYEDTILNWPAGTNNFLSLTGQNFNKDEFLKVPKFMYIGDQDTNKINDILNASYMFPESSMVDFLKTTFGDSAPDRVKNMCTYLKEIGCNIECKIYPEVGHDYTAEMQDDAFAFLKKYMDVSPPIVINVPLDFNSIQDAIDAARSGDTILISNGIYKGLGNRNINFNGKEITVRSLNGPENCIIDCEGKGRGFIFQNGENGISVLQGFKIINGQEQFGGGVYINNSSPKIVNCIISENSAEHGAGICGFNTSAFISNCEILNNNATGSGGNYFHSSSPTITNCIISKNTAGYGGGLFFYESSGNIINCTISGNTASGAGGIYCNSSNPTIVNTIIWDNSPNELGLDNSNPSIQYSVIQGGYINGTNIITKNPLFVNATKNDYHITKNSLCIDAGTSNGAPNTDIDGDSRPTGSGFDIGADEYVDLNTIPKTRAMPWIPLLLLDD